MFFPKITKLSLQNFRNFTSLELDFSESQILLHGANGAGKSNILEALTLLGRNPSLRAAKFEEMIAAEDKISNRIGGKNFVVLGEIINHDLLDQVSLAFEAMTKKKSLKINGEPYSASRQSDLKSQFINFIFLTPQIEQLFVLDKSQRRDYLDKIVCDLDVLHQNRLYSYQKLLKERLVILQKYANSGQPNSQIATWLGIVENKIVELGTAIAAARLEAIDFFNLAINSFATSFPKIALSVKGDVEELMREQSLIEVEADYRQKLAQNRNADGKDGKTSFGVHRSDFDAIFLEKNISVILSSTGEQKAAMISITLARAKIAASYRNQPTILIFDEVASHLDEMRKSDLFAEISATKLQSFFSATDPTLIPLTYLTKMQLCKISN